MRPTGDHVFLVVVQVQRPSLSCEACKPSLVRTTGRSGGRGDASPCAEPTTPVERTRVCRVSSMTTFQGPGGVQTTWDCSSTGPGRNTPTRPPDPMCGAKSARLLGVMVSAAVSERRWRQGRGDIRRAWLAVGSGGGHPHPCPAHAVGASETWTCQGEKQKESFPSNHTAARPRHRTEETKRKRASRSVNERQILGLFAPQKDRPVGASGKEAQPGWDEGKWRSHRRGRNHLLG